MAVTHTIDIGSGFTFYIPNSFSPNADGLNDYFFGSGIGIKKYDLWIFDRWGNMIFHGTELDSKWDGKDNNNKNTVLTDTYVWKVTLKDIANKNHEYIGAITLLK